MQRKREDEARQKPEGVPTLPASQWARADKRPAAEAGEDSVASGSLRRAEAVKWELSREGSGDVQERQATTLAEILRTATSEGVEDFVASFMATSSESSSSAAASIRLELHRLQQGRQV